jgi:DICT domain-containing protein/CheY-like chemotaxis protein
LDEQGSGTQPVLRSFLEVVGNRVVPTTVSKPTLTELCHALEDLVVTEDLAGTVIAGFQHARFWAIERERYEAMTADPRRRAVVFTADEDDVATSVSRVVVGTDHPLAREWFVVALNEAFSAVLFGRELTRSGEAVNGRRLFLAAWSFDPQVVDDLLAILRSALGEEVPGARSLLAAARGAHPPRHAAPGVSQRFTNAVVERLEGATQRALHAEAELRELRELRGEQAAVDRANGVVDGIAAPQVDQDSTASPSTVARSPAAGIATADVNDDPPTGATGSVPVPEESEQPTPPSGSGRRALILDEDPALRGFLEALLRRAGWEVAAASAITEAVAILQSTRCDVLLLDLDLARGPDGAGLVDLERTQPGIRQRTAFMADDLPVGGRLDGRPVLAKPVVWSDLEAVLGTLTAAL